MPEDSSKSRLSIGVYLLQLQQQQHFFLKTLQKTFILSFHDNGIFNTCTVQVFFKIEARLELVSFHRSREVANQKGYVN